MTKNKMIAAAFFAVVSLGVAGSMTVSSAMAATTNPGGGKPGGNPGGNPGNPGGPDGQDGGSTELSPLAFVLHNSQCSEEYPRYLLPNGDIVVDMTVRPRRICDQRLQLN